MDLVHAAPCTPATPAQAHLRRRGAWQTVGIGGPGRQGPAATGRWPRSDATWCTSRACQLVGLLLLGVHHTCTIAVNARGTVEGICLLGGDGGLRGASAENWRRGSVATISKSAEGILPPRIWGFSAEADLRSLNASSLDFGSQKVISTDANEKLTYNGQMVVTRPQYLPTYVLATNESLTFAT